MCCKMTLNGKNLKKNNFFGTYSKILDHLQKFLDVPDGQGISLKTCIKKLAEFCSFAEVLHFTKYQISICNLL